MHIKSTHKTDTLVEMTITANEADLSPAKASTLKKLAPQVKVQGFREGKVPLNLVEKNIDPQVMQSEFLEVAMGGLYNQALNEEDLRPVANPEVDLKKFVPYTTLEFTVTVPVIGKIVMPDLKKVKINKKPLTIEAKQVNDVIESLRTRLAERKSVERAVKDGDETTIDFKGTDEKGEAVNGAEGKDYPLQIGSDTFIPGFEANLIGMKPKETKSFTLTFPKDYGVAALQNKKVTFEVTVNKVEELVPPKLDDDFATKAGPFKTLAELKKDVKEQLTIERGREADRVYEEELLQKIAAKTTVAIPEQLVDEQIERIENEEKQNLMYRGQTWEEHLKEEGVSAEEHKEQKRPAGRDRVKIGIVLSEIAEAEKIVVTPEEFEIRINILKGQFQDATAQAELEKPEVQRDILARMITEKTIQALVDYANS